MGLIELSGVTKAFGGIKALDGADFDVRAGEVHGLVGANGAGKTTLAHVLAGIVSPDSGSVRIDGKAVSISSVADAQKFGIGVAYQTGQLLPTITAAQYLMLGHEEKGPLGVISERKTNASARAFLDRLGLNGFPAEAAIEHLTEAEKKFLGAARAILVGTRLVVFDDTAAGLTQEDAARLSHLIRTARNGEAIVISHDISFILGVCDRVTALCDGRRVGTFEASAANAGEIVRAIGNPPAVFPERVTLKGGVILSLPEIGLELRAGETVGVKAPGGLKEKLLKLIVGVDPRDRGDFSMMGFTIRSGPPRGAVRHRIGLSDDERKLGVLALYLTIRKRAAYACVERSDPGSGGSAFGAIFGGRRNPVQETAATTGNLFEPSDALGGRNPGELMLGNVDAVIFDEPSRGADESAKTEIYNLMNELARRGKGIILFSLDESEIEGMCDRTITLE